MVWWRSPIDPGSGVKKNAKLKTKIRNEKDGFKTGVIGPRLDWKNSRDICDQLLDMHHTPDRISTKSKILDLKMQTQISPGTK